MILFSQWMQLSLGTRHKIAGEFGFTKKRSTHVSNDVIVDDGFVIKEIEDALTVSNMQNYLGTTETDINVLWNSLVDKMEGREVIEPEPIPEPVPVIPPYDEVIEVEKKRGRPKSK